uniref:Zinc finger CCCH domain-containing protein 14 n=1 Tax=Cebus imitator TaxID=2715852 RepID=A0A2K5S566_CEBIM
MEIGTEISRKIRSVIKGKLQELGAYVDRELPDYIMVMVTNKKSQDQMTDDLSLFLGNNTIRFTIGLHGVLDKLHSVTTGPSGLNNVSSNKSSFSGGDERKHEATVPPRAIPSTRPEKRDSRVPTRSQESKTTNVRQTYDDGAATRLMSTAKPLREPAPSEDVTDIKPEPDDLIDEDLNFVHRNADSGVRLNRLQFQQQSRHCTPAWVTKAKLCPKKKKRNNLEKMSMEDENFWKRKFPVASSVVKVKKFNHDREEEEEDDDYGSRTESISSSVSVPPNPERRPSLPPSKQANRNLILKAVSETPESITKTTNYSTVPQKQTLPVGQSRTPIKEKETKGDSIEKNQGTQQRQLLSQRQIDPIMAETADQSFTLKKPKLSEEIVVAPNQQSGMKADSLRVLSGHLMQTRDFVQPDKPTSPKFTVMLDGVPSPQGYMSDQEEDMCFEGMKPVNQTAASNKGLRGLHPQQLHLLSRQLKDPKSSFSNADMSELSMAQKPEKLLERCKYWPVCKNGDECAYHHPISPCKAFPNCKFAEKMFCMKPDCPFTHVNRRIPALSPKPAVAPPKMECPFYHPKHCTCTRPDCTFSHPTINVPPQHASKWIRPQTSE